MFFCEREKTVRSAIENKAKYTQMNEDQENNNSQEEVRLIFSAIKEKTGE